VLKGLEKLNVNIVQEESAVISKKPPRPI